MSDSQSFYGIYHGIDDGSQVGGIVTTDWNECARLTQGVSGPSETNGVCQRKFETESAARRFAQTGEVPDPDAKPGVQKRRDNCTDVLDVYTDGSQKGDGFGWAFVVYDEGDRIFQHKESATADELGEVAEQGNVAAEMKAAMAAAAYAEDKGVKIRLHCDYEGLIKWARKQWDRNNQFTEAYANYMWSKQDHIEKFVGVEGHAGVRGNEQADKLAGLAATSAKQSENKFGEKREVVKS